MNESRIVILGAGYAGIRLARRLLAEKQYDRLTLIDQNDHHTLITNLHEVASGRVEPQTLEIPLDHILEHARVERIRDRIRSIDLESRILTGESGSYPYDQLIIASGAVPFFYGVPGAQEHSLTLNTMKDALSIRQWLRQNPDGRIVLCGAGLTGVELAADLKAMAPNLAVTLVEARDNILPDLPLPVQEKVRRKLERRGIRLMTAARVTEVCESGVRLEGCPEAELQADLVVWTSGNRAAFRLDAPQGEAAEPILDDALRLRSHPEVCAVGDGGDPDWACVENGLQSADLVAKNLLTGEGDIHSYQPSRRGLMISLGPSDGVTTTRIPLSGWPAVVLKFLVDLYYVFSVGGLGSAANYFTGHLVRPAHGRTLTGRLLSSRGQRFWLLPLRLYLGGLWFLEAWKKVIGPAQFAKAVSARDYLTVGSDSWLRPGNLQVPFAWLRDVDAVSSATMAGTNGPVLEELPVWYEALMRTIMPTPALGAFFQSLLVWAELAVGVGLILGLAVFLSALLSFALTVNFFLSGVAGWQLLWILPASLALLGGAGRIMGLDAWLIPWIHRQLKIDSL